MGRSEVDVQLLDVALGEKNAGAGNRVGGRGIVQPHGEAAYGPRRKRRISGAVDGRLVYVAVPDGSGPELVAFQGHLVEPDLRRAGGSSQLGQVEQRTLAPCSPQVHIAPAWPAEPAPGTARRVGRVQQQRLHHRCDGLARWSYIAEQRQRAGNMRSRDAGSGGLNVVRVFALIEVPIVGCGVYVCAGGRDVGLLSVVAGRARAARGIHDLMAVVRPPSGVPIADRNHVIGDRRAGEPEGARSCIASRDGDGQVVGVGIVVEQLRVGVVVQTLLNPAVAGVMFTENSHIAQIGHCAGLRLRAGAGAGLQTLESDLVVVQRVDTLGYALVMGPVDFAFYRPLARHNPGHERPVPLLILR